MHPYEGQHLCRGIQSIHVSPAYSRKQLTLQPREMKGALAEISNDAFVAAKVHRNNRCRMFAERKESLEAAIKRVA